MKATKQRGAVGAWLREARLARGYTNARHACAAMARLTGHTIHYSAWAAYESGGREIGELHKSWLEEFFGPMPEPTQDSAGALASALRELVTEVRLARIAQETSARALSEMLGVLAGLQVPGGMPTGIGLPDAGDTLLGQ
jgi:HAMP domain-containing protein